MTLVTTLAADGFSRRSFTVVEIHRMVDQGIIAENENFELIDGEVVPMSPKGNEHEVVKSALLRILARKAPEDLRLAVETSLYLDKRTFVEPDLCLYPKSILPEDVKGTDVVLAIEVSGSSISYDRERKAGVYARHGVAELWVVDAKTRTSWVHRQPESDGRWGFIDKIASEDRISPASLPDLAIRMADLD